MSFIRACVLFVAVILPPVALAATAGCSKYLPIDGDDPGLVELSLNVLPAEPGAGQAYLLLVDGEGTVLASDDEVLKPAWILGASSTSGPFDVVAYVPDDAGWDPSQPVGAGAFAVKRDLEQVPNRLSVIRWTTGETLAHAPDGGLATEAEPPVRRTLSGTVQGPDGAPLDEALVAVADQGWAYSDGSGAFTIPDLLDGTAQLTISGAGYEDTLEIEIGAASEANALSHDVAEVGSHVAYDHEGTVTDAESGLPLAGVGVFVNDAMVATTDSAGDYAFTTNGVPGVTFRHTDYAIHWTLQFICIPPSCGHQDVEMLPLEQDFYGTWTYCHTEDRGSDDRYVTELPGDGFNYIHADHTFNSDGTVVRFGWDPGFWYARKSSRTENYSFLAPRPAISGTAYTEAGANGGYRFEGDYLVSTSISVTPEHYYKPADSDVACLIEDGAGTTSGGGGSCAALSVCCPMVPWEQESVDSCLALAGAGDEALCEENLTIVRALGCG